jgi:hypothetical protein
MKDPDASLMAYPTTRLNNVALEQALHGHSRIREEAVKGLPIGDRMHLLRKAVAR